MFERLVSVVDGASKTLPSNAVDDDVALSKISPDEKPSVDVILFSLKISA